MPQKDSKPVLVTGLADLIVLNRIRGGKHMVDKLVGARVTMKIPAPKEKDS